MPTQNLTESRFGLTNKVLQLELLLAPLDSYTIHVIAG